MSAKRKRKLKAYVPTGSTRAYNDPKKHAARQFIIECWREFSGCHSIPADRDYWTLCGPLTANGVLCPSSELQQLTAEELFQPCQFVGVENKENTYNANVIAVPQGIAASRLYYGDIVDVLLEHQHAGHLAASIVHLDTVSEAKAAVRLLGAVLNVLNHIDGPTLVVWNMISERFAPCNVSYPWDANAETRAKVKGYLRDMLLEDPCFREYYRHGWDMYPEHPTLFRGLQYESTTATQMSTYVFGRRRPACGDECPCPR